MLTKVLRAPEVILTYPESTFRNKSVFYYVIQYEGEHFAIEKDLSSWN